MSTSPRYKCTIQIYDPKKYLSHNGFLEALRAHLARHSCDVAVRDAYSDVNKEEPLLVLCHTWSRLGTDINNATRELMEDFPLGSVAVLVVHEKAEYALPSTASIDTLLEEVYERFGLIVDFAFTSQTQIYKCSMNDEGERRLTEFIQKHVKMEEFEAEKKKAPNQIYCEIGSQSAQQFYDQLGALIQQDKTASCQTLDSVLDIDWSQSLLAILEDGSPLLKEFLRSKEIQKHKDKTLVVVLYDSEKKPLRDVSRPWLIHVSRRMTAEAIVDELKRVLVHESRGILSSLLHWFLGLFPIFSSIGKQKGAGSENPRALTLD